MDSILVLCEGNICRSPMAEGLFRAALPGTEVHSAGLNALSGMPADPVAVQLMQLREIDIAAHRAKQVTREMCLRADLVFVMSTEQRKRLEEKYPFACGRAFRLGEFMKCDIPDPYRKAERVFEESLQLINEGVREWLQRIHKI